MRSSVEEEWALSQHRKDPVSSETPGKEGGWPLRRDTMWWLLKLNSASNRCRFESWFCHSLLA